MRQADRFVPICDIAKETKNSVVLESPPPYRQDLRIDVRTLTGLLGMAGAEEDQLKLSFERQQPLVRATPTHAGRLAVTTKETRFKEEKGQNLKRIVYDSRNQELGLNISYPDDEVRTPTATAKNLSKRLTGALSMVPAEKYLTNFLEDLDGGLDGISVSGRAAELPMFIARMAMNILFAPITYGIFSALNHSPRPLETIGILAVANMADAVNDLRLSLDLLNGKPMDEKKTWMARAVAEQPLRAIYPVSLVHEFLLPTAKILARNSVASTQLLKSSEK